MCYSSKNVMDIPVSIKREKKKAYIAIAGCYHEWKNVLSAHESWEGAFEAIRAAAVKLGADESGVSKVEVTHKGFGLKLIIDRPGDGDALKWSENIDWDEVFDDIFHSIIKDEDDHFKTPDDDESP